MAYKGRRVKKKKLLKNPLFWAAMVAVILIIVLVAWVWNAISGLNFAIRTPDPARFSGTPHRSDRRNNISDPHKPLWPCGF